MREVFATVAQWLERGTPCALATLVESFESAPAPIGTTVAVSGGGSIAGNIGAGCYEGEIVEACADVLGDGEPRVLRINLESADAVTGSSGCGGALKIAVWKPAAAFREDAAAIARGTGEVTIAVPGGFECFYPQKRRLVLVGATTLAQDVAFIARKIDFLVTVIDPRPPFATVERIRDADEIVLEWPDEYLPRVLDAATAIVVLSHDPKFDIPALRCALRSDAAYIGLLGSRRSQAARRETLREIGFDEAALARIHGPAGLDLGGVSTSETALSILAQIVAVRNERDGRALDRTSGSIHGMPPAAV